MNISLKKMSTLCKWKLIWRRCTRRWPLWVWMYFPGLMLSFCAAGVLSEDSCLLCCGADCHPTACFPIWPQGFSSLMVGAGEFANGSDQSSNGDWSCWWLHRTICISNFLLRGTCFFVSVGLQCCAAPDLTYTRSLLDVLDICCSLHWLRCHLLEC